ncbi:MAG: twin-arginine translocase subunit TatC [Pseudobdellovibrionaceae bacterium]|uniref:twin-arginine translocase subunit TatC n=1 Tax=Oligoflexus sp. TaxID=1971216 RepID=UPI0027D098FC|nr:twin-arginine translocase subunit TatC [Oligoflexus sp.]MDQ3235070.1 twin-arginine translocase subunit TatC [Pseudobdellovibrionaceae bacterium]HYX39537.1 twin-arginine translocase subunit TatC [Oligoflexus sp.]
MTEQGKLDGQETTSRSENLKVMGLLEHVDELRSRIFKSVLAILILFMVAFYFSEHILNYLKTPLIAVLPKGANVLHFTGPMDVFMAQCKLALFVSMVVGCPIWLYQLWRFVEPALYEHEKKYAAPFLISAVLLFVSGVCFCYFVMVPWSLGYLIGLGQTVATPIITVSDYMSLLTLLMLGFGIIFETPIILIVLSMVGVVSAQSLKANRRIVMVAIVIVAAVITPTPDPVGQLIMAIPMWLLYELSIFIIQIIDKKRHANIKP